MAWAKEQADIDMLSYKEEDENKIVLIPFHSDRQLTYGKQVFIREGIFFCNLSAAA